MRHRPQDCPDGQPAWACPLCNWVVVLRLPVPDDPPPIVVDHLLDNHQERLAASYPGEPD